MPTTANTINYFVAADGTLRDGPQGSIAQQPRINYGTEYSVTLTFPASTIAEGDQLQVAVNRTRTFFSSASATGDAPVAAVAKHDVTAEEADAQAVTLTLSTNTRAMIDQVNGIDHPVRGFFGVHVLRGQSFVTLAVADALMMSLESGPDAISPSLPVVDYPTREEAEALAERSENAAERAEEAAAGIVPPLQLPSPPTTLTVGSVGQLAVWHDSDNDKDHLYHLCFVSEGESATLYHWEECVLVSQGNVAGGYPMLDVNGKVASAQLPPFSNAPEPIIGTTPPTTSTVGVVGQLYVDTVTSKTYHCTAVTVDDTDPNNVVTTYTWKEGVFLNSSNKIDNTILPRAGYSNPSTSTLGAVGLEYGQLGGLFLVSSGNNVNALRVKKSNQQNIDERTSNLTFDGTNGANNCYPIVPSTLDYSVRSVLDNVTVIPAATTSYSLLDASATTNNHSKCYSHAPTSASVYTLPAVTDAAVAHDIILDVQFSTNVLTYEFQDSAGNTLVPLPLNGDIEAGSVVTFLCRHNPLLGQWVIYPVMDGKEAQA